MNIQLTSLNHWKILFQSAFFLFFASLTIRRHPRSKRPRVVFYSAVGRPTITRLLDQLHADHTIDWDLVHCSFEQRSQQEIARYGSRVRWVSPCTWAGAKDIVRAHAIVTSDRLRTLGIVLHLKGIPFIDVWHGISFKHIKRPGFLRHYEEVWVSSAYVAELYEKKLKVPAEKLIVTGFSPSDPLWNLQKNSSERDKTAPNILIAPTYTPPNRSRKACPPRFWEDYPFLSQMAQDLGVRFTIRAHFLDCADQRFDPDIPGLTFIPQSVQPDPSPLLADADALVTDWSSLAFEYLPTGRPTIFLNNSTNRPQQFLVTPEMRWGPVVDDSQDFLSALRSFFSSQAIPPTSKESVSGEATSTFHEVPTGHGSTDRQITRLRGLIGGQFRSAQGN